MHDNHTHTPMESFCLLHGPTQQCYVFSESVSQAEDIISKSVLHYHLKLFLVECFANVFL